MGGGEVGDVGCGECMGGLEDDIEKNGSIGLGGSKKS